MKKFSIIVMPFLIVFMFISSVFTILPVNADVKEAQPRDTIKDAISAGVAWLATQQNLDGSWSDSYPIACTGFVLTKLQEYAYEIGHSPFDDDYVYKKNVINGWKFLFRTESQNQPVHMTKLPFTTQKHGEKLDNADTNGNGYGLYFNRHICYATGICLMALEASGTPNRVNDGGLDFNRDSSPDTFFEIAQDVVDFLAYAQTDSGSGEGGWTYSYVNNGSSSGDNSNSGYVVLGLAAGEEFGCTVPTWVRTALNLWIDAIQDPVDNDPYGYDGGSYYNPGGGSTNLLRTGNLIFEMTFYGDSPTTPRFVAAMDCIERNWKSSTYSYDGWGYNQNIAHYQSMFCLMKGLEYSGIDYLDLNNDTYPEHDWYQEFASVLVAQQEENGSWPQSAYSDSTKILSTCWALLVLEKVIPPESKKPFEIPPLADAGGPYMCDEGSLIFFNGSGSSDANDDALEYRWDLNGDGIWDTEWSNNSNAVYIYGDNWIGMATLKVREINTTENYTSIDKAMVTVKNVQPTVQTVPEITIYENQTLTLSADATDPGSDDLTFDWIFGNTNLSNIEHMYLCNPLNPDPYPSLEVNRRDIKDNVEWNLNKNGVYWVTVIVTDDDGDVGINNTIVTVNISTPEEPPPIEPPPIEIPNLPPIALLKANPQEGPAPLNVYFSGFGYDPDGVIVSHSWNFDDGATFSDIVAFPNNTMNFDPMHLFREPGTYTVTFSVVDDDGESDSDTATIIVHKPLKKEKTEFTISGYVYKSQTSKRIAHVQVSILNVSLLTNYSGYYSITVPSGIYNIFVSKNGYEDTSTTVTVSDDINLDFHLNPIEKPPEVETKTSATWIWAWVLVFLIIVILFIFLMVVNKRRQLAKQRMQAQEETKAKSRSFPEAKLTPAIQKSDRRRKRRLTSTTQSSQPSKPEKLPSGQDKLKP